MNDKPSRRRLSNVELLRIFAMMGIIILHYNNREIGGGFAYVQPGSINEGVLMVLESTFICAVDLFVMISGYFLCAANRRYLGRALDIVLQVSAFRVALYCRGRIRSGSVMTLSGFAAALLPDNWFISIYVALYLISPLINNALERLSDRDLRRSLAVLVILLSLLPTLNGILETLTGMEWGGLDPTGVAERNGYTIVNFALCYVLGAAIRRGLFDGASRRALPMIALLVLTVAIITLWSYWDAETARAYSNPLVLLEAVLALLLFLKLPLGEVAWINTLASCGFSVYLLHFVFLPKLGIRRFVRSRTIVMLGHIALSAVGIVLACFVVDRIYSALVHPVRRRLRTWGAYAPGEDKDGAVKQE